LGNDPIVVKITGTVWKNSANESKKIDSSTFSVRISLLYLRGKKGLIRMRNSTPKKT